MNGEELLVTAGELAYQGWGSARPAVYRQRRAGGRCGALSLSGEQ